MSKNPSGNRAVAGSGDDEGEPAVVDDYGGVVASDTADSSEPGNGGRNTAVKRSDENEALDAEECELLLKGQRQQQPHCSRVNFDEKHTSKKQQERDSREMSAYSPHKSQLKHQKSGFQLDGFRSSGQEDNTTTMNNSNGEQQTTGVNKSNLEPKTVTDSSDKTTITLTSPSLNPALHPHQHHPDSEWKGPKIWRNFVRDWPIISQPLAILVILLLFWIMAYSEVPKYASPRTTIMRIVFLFVGAQSLGIVVTFLYLPDIVGMIFFGMLYTNLGLADFSGYEEFEAILRELALINIMLLAGLGLNGSAFKKLWMTIMRLTLVPTIIEVAVICLLSHYLLNMPWFWGVLLGLVITAVSPNVVVTVMLKLREEKLGLNSGIHTLIYAMTTCNDVIAVFLFGVILGVIFHQGKFSYQVLQGPVGIVVGVVYGYVYGLLLVYLPSRKSKYVIALRFVLIVCGGCVSVMGSRAMGYPSAGALGCVTVAFTAGTLWKKQKGAVRNESVIERLDLLWKFLKPVSFALIGKELNFSVLDTRTVGYGLIVIAVASAFRLAGSYVSTAGAQLTTKERLYITISGFPKATVQAALGPIALDLARKLNSDDELVELANSVLVISVIAIIFTAPLGAILMLRLAPHWLKRGDDPDEVGMNGTPAQSQDDIAIIAVGDNGNVMDSSHTNIAFDHGNTGR